MQRHVCFLVSGLCGLAVACAEPIGPEATSSGNAARSPARPSYLAVPSPEFSWDQTKFLPTDMGTIRGRICLLTRMSGHFEGGGEFVEIVPSGGHWWLQGGSQQVGVSARARCLQVSSYGGEYVVTVISGQGIAGLDPAPALCGFTRVSGKFKTLYLDGDAVSIVPAPGGSQLIVSSSSGEWLSASARCFTGAKSTARVTWSDALPVPLPIIGGNAFCFLTEIAGHFEGGGEYLEVIPSNNFWWINGGTLQGGLEGQALCAT
jgi:hypothetical protein